MSGSRFMKVSLFVWLLLVGTAGLRAESVDPARIVCHEPVYDFGEMSDAGSATHGFVICNEGGSPLEIGKVVACCGSSARMDRLLILPGSNAILNVELPLKGRSGKQRKNFYLPSNDPATPHLSLALEGTVIAAVDMRPSFLNFGDISADNPVTNSVMVSFVQRPETTITGIVSSCKEFVAEAEDAGASRRIKVRVVPPLRQGVAGGTIRLLTDDPKHPEISFGVSATVAGGLLVIPREMLLVVSGGGVSPVTRYVALRSRSKTPFKILSVEGPDGMTKSSLSAMDSWSWRCKLEGLVPSAALNGSNIVFRTDHPESSEVSLPVRVIETGGGTTR